MMKPILIFILCFVQLYLNAQDSIYMRIGDVVPAKILEIGIKEISYKRADLLDGPLYIISKNDIVKIKYVTGIVEKYDIIKDAPKKQQVVFVNPTYIPQDNNQIRSSLRRGIYQYQGHQLSDRNVLHMVIDKNSIWKNHEIELNIIESKRNKTLQYVIGYTGAVVGGAGIYASLIGASSSSNSNDGAIAAFAGIIAGGVLVSSQIVSFTYKLKRIKNADKVVELHNQLSKN